MSRARDIGRRRTGDHSRAFRLRRLTRPMSDIEAAWLARYDRRVAAARHRKKPPPTVDPKVILAAAERRFGVPIARLRRRTRTGNNLDSDVMRVVIALALRRVGASHAVIGEAINRTVYAVSQLFKRCRNRRYLDREVEIILAEVRPVTRGDIVWQTVRVVVGDPLWCELDRRSEAAERSAAAIDHRTRDKRRDAE